MLILDAINWQTYNVFVYDKVATTTHVIITYLIYYYPNERCLTIALCHQAVHNLHSPYWMHGRVITRQSCVIFAYTNQHILSTQLVVTLLWFNNHYYFITMSVFTFILTSQTRLNSLTFVCNIVKELQISRIFYTTWAYIKC